jgi:CRP/FNR family transcriptional regulator, nitrogen fixation regulation protein
VTNRSHDVTSITFHVKFEASKAYYLKDNQIFLEGEPADKVYQVIRGAVRSYRVLAGDRRQILAFHLPGDIFGLDNGPNYRFTTDAVVDTAVRVVRRQSLEYVAATDFRVTSSLLSTIAKQLTEAEDHLMLLGRQSALERVVTFLLDMEKRMATSGTIGLPMGRRDIADYLGITLETVSRALSDLRKEGVLVFSETSQRDIVLRDRKRLLELNI